MNKSRACLLGLIIVAFCLRLGFAVASGIGHVPPPNSDDGDYIHYAENLADGKGYVGPEPGSNGDVPTAYLPPGTPFLYAGTFSVFGHSVIALRIVQCVLASITVLLLFLVAKSLFGPRSAWIAAIIFAFYPAALYYTASLLTETLFLFFLLMLTWVCIAWLARKPGWPPALVAGILFGLALLTRPSILSFLPFFCLWFFFVLPTWRSRSLVFVVLAAAALVVTPWSMYASRTYGKFVLVSPVMWTVMLQGNNRIVATDPDLAGYCVWYTDIPEYAHKFDGLNQLEREKVAHQLTLQWLGENRDKWAHLLVSKAVRFWSPFLHQESTSKKLVMLVSWGSVLLFFIPAFFITLIQAIRKRSPLIWLHLFIASVFLQTLIYFGLPRYRFPIEPFCIMLAAYAVSYLLGKLRSPSRVETKEANSVQA